MQCIIIHAYPVVIIINITILIRFILLSLSKWWLLLWESEWSLCHLQTTTTRIGWWEKKKGFLAVLHVMIIKRLLLFRMDDSLWWWWGDHKILLLFSPVFFSFNFQLTLMMIIIISMSCLKLISVNSVIFESVFPRYSLWVSFLDFDGSSWWWSSCFTNSRSYVMTQHQSNRWSSSSEKESLKSESEERKGEEERNIHDHGIHAWIYPCIILTSHHHDHSRNEHR